MDILKGQHDVFRHCVTLILCISMANFRFLKKNRYLCSANALRLTNNIINYNPQNEMLAFCKTKCSIHKTKRILLRVPLLT
nr:MAG TPA: hypothetical protein [Caudoviricetes sp.]